jgi:hypothetical protein
MIATIFRRIVPVNIFVWQSIGSYYLSLFRRVGWLIIERVDAEIRIKQMHQITKITSAHDPHNGSS